MHTHTCVRRLNDGNNSYKRYAVVYHVHTLRNTEPFIYMACATESKSWLLLAIIIALKAITKITERTPLFACNITRSKKNGNGIDWILFDPNEEEEEIVRVDNNNVVSNLFDIIYANFIQHHRWFYSQNIVLIDTLHWFEACLWNEHVIVTMPGSQIILTSALSESSKLTVEIDFYEMMMLMLYLAHFRRIYRIAVSF